jgi:drug/metabolite transporter (DMT)-like permease
LKSSGTERLKYHLLAFVVVAIWGSTFVFTKMLLNTGLSPAEIFTLRFVIAYVLLLGYDLFSIRGGIRSSLKEPCTPRTSLFASSWRDELLMVALGISGGSVYFLAENAAMLYTTTTNTSLIVCSCPLFAMLLIALFYRQSERFTITQLAGSLIACAGMAAVVLNGHFVLHLSPVGDLLAFAACLLWALYSLLMRVVASRYSSLFLTRKVFFYGLVTIVPYFLWIEDFNLSIFHSFSLPVLLNLLFLGVIASMACFLTWSWVIKKLGAVEATNWVYVNPVSTIFFAWWLLDEQITPWFLLGAILILVGMYLCDRHGTEA